MSLPIEQLLSMRAFTPLIVLRRYLENNLGLDPAAAAASLLDIDETFAASDYDAALALHATLAPTLRFVDLVGDLRQALSHLVITKRPQWARRASLGRKLFLSGLPQDVRHCFESALLLGEHQDEGVVSWWDSLCNELRSIQNMELLEQARTAERRSLDHERAQLKALGIALEPKWQALDDNTVGFDILSYRPGEVDPVNILIEVKSSSRNPPAIIISRNEWNKALEVGDRYLFHFWDVRADLLLECTPEELMSHIPGDQGVGQWLSVSIPVRELRAAKAS